MNAYKYLYRNPVRAEICKGVEDYKYSTLSGLLGGQKLIIPLIEDTLLFNPTFDDSTLLWLNRDTSKEHDEEMRLALRRAVFKLPREKSTGLASDLEKILL
jgi:hypothetical protein